MGLDCVPVVPLKKFNLLTVAEIKQKWKNLWDYYRSVKNNATKVVCGTKSGSARKNKKEWPHTAAMEFMEPFLVGRE